VHKNQQRERVKEKERESRHFESSTRMPRAGKISNKKRKRKDKGKEEVSSERSRLRLEGSSSDHRPSSADDPMEGLSVGVLLSNAACTRGKALSFSL
jgi:hypothetical protein